MGLSFFLSDYVLWHYGSALLGMWELGRNFLRFGWNFFSIPLLLKTWISPWYRMKEGYDSNFTHVEAIGAAILGNLILRIVGLLLRTSVIALGLLFCIGTIALTLITFVLWIFLPIVAITLLVSGVGVLV